MHMPRGCLIAALHAEGQLAERFGFDLTHTLAGQAQQLLARHIEISKQEVRKITLHRLHVARP